MIERERYGARAFAVMANIDVPFDAVAPPQAQLVLTPEGGYDSTRVGEYSFREVVSFASAATVVAGSRSGRDQTFDLLATTTIEGFNVLGVVTADKIVARMAAYYSLEGGPLSVLPLGSHFENLRIAGYRVEVDLATDTFSRLATAESVREAYRENDDGFRDEFDALSLRGRSDGILARLQRYFPWSALQPGNEIPQQDGLIQCGLVREISGLGSEVECHGHTIYVRGFGAIRLAELRLTDAFRRLSMVEIDLGSTPQGHVSGGGVGAPGSGW